MSLRDNLITQNKNKLDLTVSNDKNSLTPINEETFSLPMEESGKVVTPKREVCNVSKELCNNHSN